MSGCDHQWYPAVIIPFGMHVSNYITTVICVRTSAALLKAAAQNLQKNSLLRTHLNMHTVAALHSLNHCEKELLT